MMKTYVLKFCNGDLGELREFEGEGWACPICGTIWKQFPPHYPNDGVLGRIAEFSAPNIGESCAGCEIEFNVAPVAPPGFARRLIAKYRTQWLDSVGWERDALTQLETRLGVSEQQARADADDARRMP